jgi:lipopolysaccharide transport system permease protein
MNGELEAERWDLVIRPRRGLLDLDLAEVWRYRDLLIQFVRRDFLALYKQTILGPLWFFIQPALTAAMYLVIFRQIAGIGTGAVPPVLFYMSGIILWAYFSECVTSTANTFLLNAGIFGKVYFPRILVPASKVIASLVKLGLQFLLFLLVLGYYALWGGIPLHAGGSMLLLPVLALIAGLLGMGVGTIVSALTTKYRDLTHLLSFGVQLLMFATPVIYPLEAIRQPRLHRLIELNPMTPVIESFRSIFFGGAAPSIPMLAYSFVVALGLFAIGLLLFNRVESRFMDTI